MESSSSSRPPIIASGADAASINIAENLIQNFQFSKRGSSNDEMAFYFRGNISLTIIDKLGIFSDPEDVPHGSTSLVFASKHVSASGKTCPDGTCHRQPYSRSIVGGNPEHLSFVDPFRIMEALRTLRDESAKKGLQIEVTMEATAPWSDELPDSGCVR
jgi:D-tyrosyl-tRNA(Tyr) deacylase